MGRFEVREAEGKHYVEHVVSGDETFILSRSFNCADEKQALELAQLLNAVQLNGMRLGIAYSIDASKATQLEVCTLALGPIRPGSVVKLAAPCCERDHNRDGNCDRHPERLMTVESTEVDGGVAYAHVVWFDANNQGPHKEILPIRTKLVFVR